MSQEGYLQTKVRELQDKVDVFNKNIDEKVGEMERIEREIDNKLKGKLNLIIEAEGKIDNFVEMLAKNQSKIINERLIQEEKILASRIRNGILYNARLIIKMQQDGFDGAESALREFHKNVFANIKILFTELYGLCDKLNIKRNELPNIPNEWGIRKGTVEDITPIIEKKLDELGFKEEYKNTKGAKTGL